MKSRFSLWVMCLLFASVFLLPQAAHAQCNATTLTGSWSYSLVSGFTPQPTGPYSNPFSVSFGTIVADGAGKFTDTDSTLFFLSLLIPPPIPPATIDVHSQGYYTVNANCTGTLTFHINNLSVHFDFVLVNGGPGPNTQMYWINSDTNMGLNVISGKATKL